MIFPNIVLFMMVGSTVLSPIGVPLGRNLVTVKIIIDNVRAACMNLNNLHFIVNWYNVGCLHMHYQVQLESEK